MVFIRDRGSFFEATIDQVWTFLGSGAPHAEAHAHRNVTRRSLPGNAGVYSWEQDFDGTPARFTMRWTAFLPLGIAYEVLEGPFAGSSFFLYYIPQGPRTGVDVVSEFVSSTLPANRIEPAVRRFFSVEFDQDRAAIEHRPGKARTSGQRRGSRSRKA